MPDPTTVDPATKFGEQRHAFILAYYNMAVQDLSRHLGVGWQTLTSVIGTIALLSLAQDAKLPLPIAVAVALTIGFWGVLNILDADYWATRAIAFLANVEAVYFYRDERRIFNSYAGFHPPLKVMDSLKYQLIAVSVLIALACLFYIAKICAKAGSFQDFVLMTRGAPLWQLIYWTAPLYVFLFMFWMVIRTRCKRIEDYLSFVTESPGPGMITNRSIVRGMDLAMKIEAKDIDAGEQMQAKLRESLKSSLAKWKHREAATGTFALLILGGCLLAVFLR